MPASSAPYDALAEVYDWLTGGPEVDRWVDRLLAVAADHGLRGRRLLDLACGTGQAHPLLARRGFDVVGVDLSPGMLVAARLRGARRLVHADMRALPLLGEFDLVTCLNDSVNHLAEADDLVAAFSGAARSLAPRGLLVFDVTTPQAYAAAHDAVLERDGELLIWRGRHAAVTSDGTRTEVRVERLRRRADLTWTRETWLQPHRCFSLEELEAALAAAGLDLVCVLGQREGGELVTPADPGGDRKLLLLAQLAPIPTRKEDDMVWRP